MEKVRVLNENENLIPDNVVSISYNNNEKRNIIFELNTILIGEKIMSFFKFVEHIKSQDFIKFANFVTSEELYINSIINKDVEIALWRLTDIFVGENKSIDRALQKFEQLKDDIELLIYELIKEDIIEQLVELYENGYMEAEG